MTVRERVPAPAVRDANPLLPLVSPDPDDAWLLLDEIRQLPCTSQSAHWLDVLLDDPRLEALPKVREAAVEKLLAFGHPHALLINPDHLAQFRRTHPTDLRPGLVLLGASVALVACVLAFRGLGIVGLIRHGIWVPGAEVALAGAWALAVALRAGWTRSLRRGWLIGEVVTALAGATALIALEAGTGVGLLAAAVPISLAGLAGGWSES